MSIIINIIYILNHLYNSKNKIKIKFIIINIKK